ncbi:MAG: biotin-dependent carboxyltransferase family protein [Parasphingorhabdus sp.]|uniref:5-oxoprolinase subunit C family protein n=2 Tax=Parasphingorhabdus sp. TaxID=2709688 RepID=UPI003263E037
MSMRVLKAGLQTTLQGVPFAGHRKIGMPAAGAADCLSLALANSLVGKPSGAVAIEITLTEAVFEIQEPCSIGVVGGAEFLRINDVVHPQHQTIDLLAGDKIHLGPSHQGTRTYLAVSAAIHADQVLDGQSTYLTAGLGGHHGRALQTEDIIAFTQAPSNQRRNRSTPLHLRPHYSEDYMLRVTPGPEADSPDAAVVEALCRSPYVIGARMNRMGLALEGDSLERETFSNMPSAAVFPGTIQLPESGQPYLLGPDAQTTGGYPRIAQVIRADRHLIGQLSSGSKIRLVRVTAERATEIYREKLSLLTPWLGQINFW